MIDTHIHLSMESYDQTFPYIGIEDGEFAVLNGNRALLIEKMKEAGIEWCLEPAADLDSNEKLLKLSEENPGYIYPAVGNHPTRCIKSRLRDFKRLKEYSERAGIVAIGETGLDYHYKRLKQHRIRQKIWFRRQINLADSLGLPLVLHIRKAETDAIKILRKNREKLHGGVCHCYRGDKESAEILTKEFGLYLGIGGTVLNDTDIGESLRETLEVIPLEYIVLETDGPYIKPDKPENVTGKRWQKAKTTSLILPAVAEKIAEIKKVSTKEVIEKTSENARKLFGIKN